MKVFNLAFLSLGFAILTVLGVCYLCDQFLPESFKFVAALPAIAIGANARRIMEKILGYTMEDAFKEESQ